jgi:hypothetical protein
METGKVEYAPDYKSKRGMGQPFSEFLAEQMRDPEFAEAYKATDVEVEHARLKDAVVDAVKEERRLERLADEGRNTLVRTDALIAVHDASRVKRSAVDALIAFEAEHKIGEK